MSKTWEIVIADRHKSWLYTTWDPNGPDQMLLQWEWEELVRAVQGDDYSINNCHPGSASYTAIVAGPAIDFFEMAVERKLGIVAA